jgi:hypothetical protein
MDQILYYQLHLYKLLADFLIKKILCHFHIVLFSKIAFFHAMQNKVRNI